MKSYNHDLVNEYIRTAAGNSLIGQHGGIFDVSCPNCGPDRRSPINRRRKVLRIWQSDDGLLSYYCARCGMCGSSRTAGERTNQLAISSRAATVSCRSAVDEADVSHRRKKALWLWRRGRDPHGSSAEVYLRSARATLVRFPEPFDISLLLRNSRHQ